MWVGVWILQGLLAFAAGVYLNTPCIRSLVRCAPFQLSLSDGQFSNNFIEDVATLNRKCKSLDPLLECMEEAELGHCNDLNISPAEKVFIKTRLFIAEVCKDVEYTQKEYLKNAACINRERDQVIQACIPHDYVQVVNTSNIISLEGSCLFQQMLINCRRDAIQDKCGPDAADLYQSVKAVDMNLDFLCLERRDLGSPKFMLDVVINSYISLLLETLRPVLIMESFHLRDMALKETPKKGCIGSNCRPSKASKMPAYSVQDVAEYKWRRLGDIPVETSTGAFEGFSVDSNGEEYFPVPSLKTGSDSTFTEAGLYTETGVTDFESAVDALVLEDSSSDSSKDHEADSGAVEEETSSDFLNNASTESELVTDNNDGSGTKVIFGISIPQFEQDEVLTTQNADIYDATSTHLDIEKLGIRSPSGIEVTTDFDEFQGTATQYPEYPVTTSADLHMDQDTTLNPDDHETSDTVNDTPGDNVASTADHSNDQKVDSSNSKAFVQEATTLYPSDIRDLYTSKENSFDVNLLIKTLTANSEKIASVFSSPSKIINLAKYFSTRIESLKFKSFLKDWWERFGSLSQVSESYEKELNALKNELRVEFVSFALNAYKDISKTTSGSNLGEESTTSEVQRGATPEANVFEESTSSTDSSKDVNTEIVSLEEEVKESSSSGIETGKMNEWIDIEKELKLRIVSAVINKISTMFAPPKIERRASGDENPRNDKFADVKSEKANETGDERLPLVAEVEYILKANTESIDLNFVGESSASDSIDYSSASSQENAGSMKVAFHQADVKTLDEPIGELMTLKSIVELGVKLNYVLIGESYLPLEVGYSKGNEDGKFNRNLKIESRKFKFYTSTPTEPSTWIPHDLDSATDPSVETTTHDPGSRSISDDEEMPNSKEMFEDLSCPVIAGNLTPRTSLLVDSEQRLRTGDCVRLSELGEKNVPDEDSSEFSMEAGDNPDETNREFRRSGDIEEVPEKNLRDLDLETKVALKFYGEVLTELAAMLPPGSPESNILAKGASSLMTNMMANKNADPSEIVTMAIDELKSKRFQKRSSLGSQCVYQKGDNLGFQIQYSPESAINIKVLYKNEREVDIMRAEYVRIGETKMNVKIYFTLDNKDYVHSADVSVGPKLLPLERISFGEL